MTMTKANVCLLLEMKLIVFSTHQKTWPQYEMIFFHVGIVHIPCSTSLLCVADIVCWTGTPLVDAGCIKDDREAIFSATNEPLVLLISSKGYYMWKLLTSESALVFFGSTNRLRCMSHVHDWHLKAASSSTVFGNKVWAWIQKILLRGDMWGSDTAWNYCHSQ